MSSPSSLPTGPTGDEMQDLQLFFESLHQGPFGYLFADGTGHVKHYNEKLQELLCAEGEALRNRSLFDFLIADECVRLQAAIEKSTFHFGDPLRLVKVKCTKRPYRFVTIYLKRLEQSFYEQDMYIFVFLRNEFNPLSESKEENEAFYRAIIETQEAEREFIGAALHDNVAQELYAIRLNLQRFLIEHGFETEIAPIKKMLNDAIYNVCNISNDLTPAVLRDMGFLKAIEDLIFRLNRADVRFVAQIDPAMEHLSKELQFCCYRIIQELFGNSLRHARANRVSLTMQRRADYACIVVDDNGHGFREDIDSSLSLGTGLRNIKNRIALYAGSMDMSSSSQGSRIQIKLYT